MNTETHRFVTRTEPWLQRADAHGVQYDETGKSFEEIALDYYEPSDAYRELFVPDPMGPTGAAVSAAASSKSKPSRSPYMVTSAHGLDSSPYTFNYVAGWALNAVTEQRDLAEILRSTGQRVIGAADLILQATQPTPSVTDVALDALETDVRTQVDPDRWEAVAASAAPAPELTSACSPVATPALAL